MNAKRMTYQGVMTVHKKNVGLAKAIERALLEAAEKSTALRTLLMNGEVKKLTATNGVAGRASMEDLLNDLKQVARWLTELQLGVEYKPTVATLVAEKIGKREQWLVGREVYAINDYGKPHGRPLVISDAKHDGSTQTVKIKIGWRNNTPASQWFPFCNYQLIPLAGVPSRAKKGKVKREPKIVGKVKNAGRRPTKAVPKKKGRAIR